IEIATIGTICALRACEQITLNAETAEAAEKKCPEISHRALRALRSTSHFSQAHEALSRHADDGVPVHETQMLAGHENITTTQRYVNARPLAQSMRHARAPREPS